MNKKQYKTRITTASKNVGTYKKSFDHVIATLADILEERDRVRKQYLDEGAEPLVTVVSDRGAENRRPNPLLRQWNDLNTTALAYWRDLGLTPAGLKKINDETLKEKPKGSKLDEVLSKLG